MKIESGDVAGIITACGAFIGLIVTQVTSLIMTIRNRRAVKQHGERLTELESASGVHKTLPDA